MSIFFIMAPNILHRWMQIQFLFDIWDCYIFCDSKRRYDYLIWTIFSNFSRENSHTQWINHHQITIIKNWWQNFDLVSWKIQKYFVQPYWQCSDYLQSLFSNRNFSPIWKKCKYLCIWIIFFINHILKNIHHSPRHYPTIYKCFFHSDSIIIKLFSQIVLKKNWKTIN